MDIVSSRFHQPGLAARLFLLLAFCFMGVTQANAIVAAGEWQSANDLSVAQGDRFYDRNLRAYFTYNTVTASSGESLSGDLRLVVLSSSHSVLNADGTNADGNPFFMVPAGSAEHVVRINFQHRRGGFSYTTQMQRLVETTDPDSDSDGVPNSADICANTPEGEEVDEVGCAQSQLDDDNDRVNNNIDQCPNTPEGESVDEAGCAQSQLDDDNDSVNNNIDQCPNTPAGEEVDEAGCAQSQLDDDNDRVNNVIDQCPNTPEGEEVDEVGCAQSQLDDDDDGIANSDDFCPDDPFNACFTLNITVRGGSTPLPDVAVVVGIDAPGGATTSSSTDQDGELSVGVGHPGSIGDDGLDDFFPVSAIIDGFATGFAKVVLAPGVFDYDLLIDLAPVSDIIGDEEDVTAGVSIEKEDETVGELTIPESSFPPEVTAITGQITYLDPEGDIGLTPGGDLLALPDGANPNEPVPLETFGMMEFDLVDQNGDPITDLAAPAEVCMKAGAGLAAGDTIPLWYYDDEAGLWIEEGQGTVEDRDGILMICGEVNHFSWWNYDQPINTHSCFKYHFIDGDTGDSLREEFNWYAEGVTYNGSSPERLCDRDGDDPVTPAPGDGDIDSLTVKRTTDINAPEQIRVTTTIAGTKYYLVDDGDATYSLSANMNNGAVFNNPELNASCLNNTNVSDCLFLDYKEGPAANGILPLDVGGIDFAPVISGLGSNVGLWGNMDAGTATDVFATVTDPEGFAVDVAWSTSCYGTSGDGDFDPISQNGSSGLTFTSTFTAPATVNFFYSYCELTITATDVAGNVSTASQWVNVIDPDFSFVITGVLYGPDGLPMANQDVDLDSFCDIANSTTITTDSEGAYSLDFADVCGGEEGFYGEIRIDFNYGGVDWNYMQYIDAYYCGFYFGEFEGRDPGSCEFDIHLPTVWAPVSGSVDVLPFEHTIFIESYFYSSEFGGELTASLTVPTNATTYGPIMLPVSSDGGWLRGNNVGRGFQLPSADSAILDVSSATGSVLITVYDRANPLAGPLAGVDVDINTNNGATATGVTDANGQFLATGLPLGQASVSASGLTTGFGIGYIDQGGQQVVIDINSPNTCTIAGTTFDPFGAALGSVSVNYWNSTVGQSGSTASVGDGSFTLLELSPGFGELYAFDSGFSFGSNTFAIDNCQPVGGSPRVFSVDLPLQINFFGGLE